jgi:hypothetical protein
MSAAIQARIVRAVLNARAFRRVFITGSFPTCVNNPARAVDTRLPRQDPALAVCESER